MGKEARVKAERRQSRVHLSVISDVVHHYKDDALPAIDKVIAVQNAASAESGRPTRCSRGCAGCCHQIVAIDIVEAFVIADYVIKTGLATPELATMMARHARRQAEEDRGEWFRSNTPCMFLDTETKDCRIYSVRPTPCRGHYAVSDPANCFPEAPVQDIAFVNSWPAIVVNRKSAATLLMAARKYIPELPDWLGVGAMPLMIIAAMGVIRHGGERLRSLIKMVKPEGYTEEAFLNHDVPGDDREGRLRYVSHVIARAGYDPEQFGIPRPDSFAPAAADDSASAAGTVRGGVSEPPAP